ncbi:TetR/AcrR family transcriptional regulator [Nocardioides gilvus]|uniref:TetR/AcrR family transcriptional regulator n=1 Tax=Nocardioides gilvus TaxID=1735589 RepID=UPI000D745B58|nr:TetR/AcrR family transcriptional regulator [Nocardioides gilvus]
MPTRDDETSSRGRILATATDLFAQRGYEATSTRSIADAVGLNIATVAYHVGNKSALYLEVMRAAHATQRDAVTEALVRLAECEPTVEATRRGLHAFVDAYLDFCLRHPEVPALWMRRWLDEGEDVSAVEEEFAGPLVARVSEEVRRVLERARITRDLDVEMLVYSIVWTSHSFSQAGLVDASGTRQDPSSPQMMDRFRRHLHGLVDGAISLRA